MSPQRAWRGDDGISASAPDGSIVVQRWEEIKNSAHPIWTDKQINQLRRDFLQYVGIVGDQDLGIKERQTDKQKLREFGERLIANLKGNESKIGVASDIAESYPNVRIADNLSIYDQILNGPDRQKFLGLLASGKLDAWARPMRGNRDFVKIPKDDWEKHYIDVHLNSGESINDSGAFKTHSQTYFRTKQRKESTHYDVCLNKAQVLKVWPALSLIEDHDEAGA